MIQINVKYLSSEEGQVCFSCQWIEAEVFYYTYDLKGETCEEDLKPEPVKPAGM